VTWLSKLFGESSAEKSSAEGATARNLQQLVRKCPVCEGQLPGHLFRLLGTTICGQPLCLEEIREFMSAVQAQDWPSVETFHQFDGTKDALIAYALKCPSGGAAIAVIRSKAELFDNDEVMLLESIPWPDSDRMGTADSGEWQHFILNADNRNL
jgi:hypothetical protein